MYDFIFNFFYRYHKRGRSFGPRSTAALAVAITTVFQIFCLVAVILFFTGFNIAGKPISHDYLTNKLYLMPFMMAYGLIFILYYNHKRAMTVVNKYPKDYKLITAKNIFLVLIIMIAPLLIGIWFLQHTH